MATELTMALLKRKWRIHPSKRVSGGLLEVGHCGADSLADVPTTVDSASFLLVIVPNRLPSSSQVDVDRRKRASPSHP